jgi:hypothetical protein
MMMIHLIHLRTEQPHMLLGVVRRMLREHSRQSLLCDPRQGESVRDWHKVDHVWVDCARFDLSQEGAQVLHPHVLDGRLTARSAGIKIIHALRHHVVLLDLHEQD